MIKGVINLQLIIHNSSTMTIVQCKRNLLCTKRNRHIGSCKLIRGNIQPRNMDNSAGDNTSELRSLVEEGYTRLREAEDTAVKKLTDEVVALSKHIQERMSGFEESVKSAEVMITSKQNAATESMISCADECIARVTRSNQSVPTRGSDLTADNHVKPAVKVETGQCTFIGLRGTNLGVRCTKRSYRDDQRCSRHCRRMRPKRNCCTRMVVWKDLDIAIETDEPEVVDVDDELVILEEPDDAEEYGESGEVAYPIVVVPTHLQLAEECYIHGDYIEAIMYLSEEIAASVGSTQDDLFNNRGLCYMKLDVEQQRASAYPRGRMSPLLKWALDDIDTCLKLRPDNTLALER